MSRWKLLVFVVCLAIGMSRNISSNALVMNNLASKDDVQMVAELIYLENGGSIERMYYTGCVLLNRVKYCSWCPDTIYAVIHQKGQYAVASKVGKTKPSNDAYMIAIIILNFGYDAPRNLVYQSRFKQGSKVWKVIDGEYFCLE